MTRRRVEFLAWIDGRLAAGDRGKQEQGGDEACRSKHQGLWSAEMLNFSCAARSALAFMLLAGLAACSSGETAFERPNTSPATREADYADCRSEAKATTRQSVGIDEDIAASSADSHIGGDYATRLSNSTGAGESEFGAVLETCMQAKGYRPQ